MFVIVLTCIRIRIQIPSPHPDPLKNEFGSTTLDMTFMFLEDWPEGCEGLRQIPRGAGLLRFPPGSPQPDQEPRGELGAAEAAATQGEVYR